MIENGPKELPTPSTKDFALMIHLSEDLGGNLRASNFIGNIDTFITNTSQFDTLVDDFVRLRLFWRERNELQPEIQELDYDGLIQYAKNRAITFYSGEISIAEAELIVTLQDLKDRGLVNRALQVMNILGLRHTEDEFQLVEKDEERSTRIIQIAKIMDPDFRTLVEGNSGYFQKRNPALYDMIHGLGTGDPDLNSRYRQLEDEL